jgi:hypothetical protein
VATGPLTVSVVTLTNGSLHVTDCTDTGVVANEITSNPTLFVFNVLLPAVVQHCPWFNLARVMFVFSMHVYGCGHCCTLSLSKSQTIGDGFGPYSYNNGLPTGQPCTPAGVGAGVVVLSSCRALNGLQQ